MAPLQLLVPNKNTRVSLGTGRHVMTVRLYIGVGPLLVKLRGDRGEVKAQSTDYVIYEGDEAVAVLPAEIFLRFLPEAYVFVSGGLHSAVAPQTDKRNPPPFEPNRPAPAVPPAPASTAPASEPSKSTSNLRYDKTGKLDPKGLYDANGKLIA